MVNDIEDSEDNLSEFQKIILKIKKVFEIILWLGVAIFTLYITILYIMGEMKYTTFNNFLSQDVFYSIIGFEFAFMALMRLAGASHLHMIFQLILLVILGICREMFLKHVINWDIALALLLSVITLVVVYKLLPDKNNN